MSKTEQLVVRRRNYKQYFNSFFILGFTLKYMLGNVHINIVRTPILLGGGEPPIKFSKEEGLIGTEFLEGLLGKRG